MLGASPILPPDFVQTVLKQSKEDFERRYRLKARGVDLNIIAKHVSALLDIPVEEVWSKGKYRQIVAARSLLCYWAVNELNINISELARRFDVSPTAISKSVLRGKTLAKEGGYKLESYNV